MPSMLRVLWLLAIPVTLSGQDALQGIVDRWTDDPYFQHASVGVAITDAATGQLVADYQGNKSLIPASNLKVLTTASALAILGADYRYETHLAYDGYVDAQGILNGNLYLVGSGDPSLGSPQLDGTSGLDALLERWRLAVQRAGIRQIAGRIITDASYFDAAAQGSHWQWLDLGNYYGCGVFGLNLHENLYYLRFQQQTRLGATPSVADVSPAVPGLRFVNEITSAERGSGDNAYIYGAPYTYLRYLRGTLPVGSGRFTIKGAIPDPPLFAAQHLRDALEKIGIVCQRPPATLRGLGPQAPALGERKIIDTHRSLPLQAIVDRTNMRSVNLYAEALLRTIGRHVKKEGTTAAGLTAVREFWEDRGLDWGGVQLYDGSGMSPRNVLPPAVFSALLGKAYRDEQLRPALLQSLPLAGRSGSLRNSLRGTAAEGNLRAKSGSLEQVRGYSGYVTQRSGRVLAFSILLNNYDGGGGPARRKLLDLMAKLAE